MLPAVLTPASWTHAAPPSAVEAAILRTLLYADVFDYPLTPAEIHHYLIGHAASADAVHAALHTSAWLAGRVTLTAGGYFAVQDRAHIGPLRDERNRHAAKLWPSARRWARLIGCLPFVRMVAVTGALAMDNAPPGDDIDLLIVTAPGRVWLARALVVGLVRAARLLGVGLCPNYVLSQSALGQERRDLFVAHDLAQMVTLVGQGVAARMRAANAWAWRYLPHARTPLRSEPDLAPRGLWRRVRQWGERLLCGRLGDALETWERRRKTRKFAGAAQRPGSAARLDADHVKGHFNDHGYLILKKFEARLTPYLWSLDEVDLTVRRSLIPGDW